MSITSEHFYIKIQNGDSGVAGVGSEEAGSGRVGFGVFARRLLERVLSGMDARRANKRMAMASLESEIAADEPASVIEALEAQIGKKGKDHARTAYVIGRQYMRLGQFDEAREWLRRAQRQSGKLSFLHQSIAAHVSTCSIQLIAEGDSCFADGDYHGARERYARISQGLARSEQGRLALFLRSACVYCKLCDYEEAAQAVLQALKSDEQTDRALALLHLLRKLSSQRDDATETIEARERLEDQLAGQVTGLMTSLVGQRREWAGASS